MRLRFAYSRNLASGFFECHFSVLDLVHVRQQRCPFTGLIYRLSPDNGCPFGQCVFLASFCRPFFALSNWLSELVPGNR